MPRPLPSGSVGPFARALATLAAVLLAFALFVRFGPLGTVTALCSFAYPALPMLILMGIILAMVLSAAIRRTWFGRALLLLSAALLAEALYASLWPSLPPPEASQRPIRIVEFNAWLLNRDPAGASRWILAQHPDVVVLLEAAGTGGVIADTLATALPHRFTCRVRHSCSTVILSRQAPIEIRPLAHGDPDNRKGLSALLLRFAAPAGTYAVVAVHLSRPLPAGRQGDEIEQLVAVLSNEPREGLIMTGDFNAPLWSRPMRRLMSGLGLIPIAPDTPSWPAPPAGEAFPPIAPIDHALLGSGWSAAGMKRGPEIGSDHYPAVIDLVRSAAP